MRALSISRSLLTSLSSIHLRNVAEKRPTILFHSTNRMLSSHKQNEDDTVKIFQNDDRVEPKYRKKTLDYKQKINLVDISGKPIGQKTRQEAMQIANKNNWILVEDDLSKKTQTYKLVDPREMLKAEEVQDIKIEHDNEHQSDDVDVESDASSQPAKLHQNPSQKFLLFSSKISEHDLLIKMNHIKKWLARGNSIKVRVNAAKANSYDKLKFIDRQLEKTFNSPEFGIKINQRRVTQEELMLTVVPFDKLLAKNIATTTDKNNDKKSDSDTDMDPNELLAGGLNQSDTTKK